MLQKTVAVTGANGYIGLHIVNQLLKSNFNVVATVRDANNAEKIKDLKALEKSETNLKIVSADLQNAEGFLEAFKNVDAVVHNASPVTTSGGTFSGNEEEYVPPAIQGVDNAVNAILKNSSSIRNVVFISSMAAVCGAPGSRPSDHVFSSNDWSDPENQRQRKAWYGLSKTLAEQKFNSYKEEMDKLNIKSAVICPTLVTGPLLGSQIGSSLTIVSNYLNGSKELIPNSSMSLVDVRDVGELCVQAILKNAEGRFIAVEKGYTFEQIVEAMRKGAGDKGDKIPTKVQEGEKQVPSVFDLQKSLELLGKPFISGSTSVSETTLSLLQKNLV